MGQKVDPRAMRLGINRSHDSNWWASKRDYVDFLHEDLAVRKHIETKLKNSEIARVEINRASSDQISIIIHACKVGLILGRKGEGVDNLKKELAQLTPRKIDIKVKEIPYTELSAPVIGLQVAQAIEKRTPFKKAMNSAIMRAKKAGTQGIKISVSGRLNGAEIARTEKAFFGKVPLHSIKYDIDFARVEAKTVYGIIGIKVWLSKGIKEVSHVDA